MTKKHNSQTPNSDTNPLDHPSPEIMRKNTEQGENKDLEVPPQDTACLIHSQSSLILTDKAQKKIQDRIDAQIKAILKYTFKGQRGGSRNQVQPFNDSFKSDSLPDDSEEIKINNLGEIKVEDVEDPNYNRKNRILDVIQEGEERKTSLTESPDLSRDEDQYKFDDDVDSQT